jgi:hypothetical protein
MARGAPLLFAAALAAAGLPAAAQQPPPGNRLVLPMPWAPPPGAAGPGVPPSFDPESVRPGQEPAIDCGRDLPCRMRLRGVLGKNGAIAVEGTAFTW